MNNKKTVWESERISQTSGKIFSTIWSKMLSTSSAEELSGSLSWKKPFFQCLPNFALKILRLSPKSFSKVFKTAFQLSGGKLWGLIQKKDVILANSENWANFFLDFSLTFSGSLSKLREKHRWKKSFFLKKAVFFRSFPTIYQKFQDLPPIFFNGLSNVPFQCPDELCLAN